MQVLWYNTRTSIFPRMCYMVDNNVWLHSSRSSLLYSGLVTYYRGENTKVLVEKPKFNVCGSVHLGNMFYSNPTGCTIFFFLEKFLALHVSDATRVHRQEHNCSVQP
jgi:hypothetical protein